MVGRIVCRRRQGDPSFVDVRDDAAPAGLGQAAAMGAALHLRDLTDRDALEQLSSLLRTVWGAAEPIVPLTMLRALSDTGGLVLGAFAGSAMVGGAVGFRAADDPARLHSHVVGVSADWQRRGVGSAIKRQQRSWCLDRGMTHITWTFDPLVRRNVLFNINRLGAVGCAYLVDYYGPMDDAYNVGVPTDRVLLRWEFEGQRRRRPPRTAESVLDIGEHGQPCPIGQPRPAGRVADRPVRLRLPATVPGEHAIAWRVALREVMAPRLAEGYRWTALSDDGWAVLEPPSALCLRRPGEDQFG
jgi:predicted GNAT superfamily acetyltransferase